MAESILITGNNVSLAEFLGDKFVPMSISGGMGEPQSYTLPCRHLKTLKIEKLVTTIGDAEIHSKIIMDGSATLFTNFPSFGTGIDIFAISCTDNILTIKYETMMYMDTFNMTDVIISYEGFESPVCTVKNTTMGLMGDAVRKLTGKTERLTPSEMVEAIKANTLTYGFMPTKWENGYPVEGIWFGESVADFAFASLYQKGGLSSVTTDDYGKPFCLKKITFANAVKTIGRGAFAGCTKLENFEIPDTVETIGDNAFYAAVGMTDQFKQMLYIPASVKTIGAKILDSGTMGVAQICFKGTPTSIDTNAFNNPMIVDVYVPWAEGEVSVEGESTSWGAVSATVHYNYPVDDL